MWNKNKNESIQAGLALHKDIEDYYDEKSIENNSVEYQYF